MGALDGVRVVDLSRVLAGPFATMLLGDLGAEVIKVEPPFGDETRAWGPPFLGPFSAYYLTVNRNKRSLVLDLKTDGGRAVLLDLVRTADVLVENFKPGTMERFGLGYDVLRRHNPRLIYVAISGFGQTGPDRALPGYDFIVQAMGGMMAITGEPDGPPLKVGVAVADLAAGFYAAIGILAALIARGRTGEGQFIDVALLDAQVALLANAAMNYLVSGEEPRRYGNAHPNIVPYQAFEAADGPMIVAVGNERQFTALCAAVGRPEWAEDPRFRTNADRLRNRKALVEALAAVFRTATRDVWIERLRAAGVPVGPVRTLSEVFSDPHVLQRGMRFALSHPAVGAVPQLGNPLKLSGTPVEYRLPPPLIGEGGEEALAALGLDLPKGAKPSERASERGERP